MTTAATASPAPTAFSLSPAGSVPVSGRPWLLWFTCTVVLLDNLGGFDALLVIGPISLYLLDLATLVYAAYALRHLRRIFRGGLPLLALLLCLCCTIAWIRGALLIHPVTAGNAIRLSAWFAAAMLAGSLVRYRPADCAPPLLAITTGLLAITIGRWLHLIPYPGELVNYFSIGGMLRPLTAAGTVALFLACAIALACKRSLWWIFLITGPVLVLLQHRSVWILMAVYACWLGWDRVRRRAMSNRDLIATCLLAIAAVCVIALPTPLADSLLGSAQEMSVSSGTGGWRVETNRSVLANFPSLPLTDQLLGLPAGTPWDLEIDNRTYSVHPHTMYLITLLDLGWVGLSLLAVILIHCLHCTWRNRQHFGPDGTAIVIALLAYGLAYGYGYFVGFILGLMVMNGTGEDQRHGDTGIARA